jgi:hypothetical protein
MVDIALGLGSLALLIPVNNLILDFAKKKPHLANGVPGLSMFINAFIVVLYGHLLKPLSVDVKLFLGGLLMAIFISMVTKVSKLLNN